MIHFLYSIFSLTSGEDLLSTDLKPNDGYSILVGHILIDIWRESGDDRFLSEILVILEEAVLHSPSNYQIKLLLIKLYNSIGVYFKIKILVPLFHI